MRTVPFALYDAFSEFVFGGSQAGIVSDAAWIDADARRRIAREIGAPATCFVSASSQHSVSVRFQSTESEYPMCGHGSICLITQMVEHGIVNWHGGERIDVELCLPSATAAVEISRRSDGRPLVMLDIQPPSFRQDSLNPREIARLLGLEQEDFSRTLPLETVVGDFVHLVVPVRDLAAMRRMDPDFTGLTRFWHTHGIQTIAAFCREVERPDHHLHVRDFCPAVGVPESAAAGTTNAALTSYLIRHEVVAANSDGRIIIQAEQGHEIDRASSIRSVVTMDNNTIARLQIGGVATKVLDGHLYLPSE